MGQDARKKWLWRGKPVVDLTREELIDALIQLIIASRQQHQHSLELLQFHKEMQERR